MTNEYNFSNRIQWLQPSSIRKMMGIAKTLKEQGKIVYELNIGQPDVPFIEDFKNALCQKIQEGHASYAPFIGESFLRETFARYLNNYFDSKSLAHLVVDTENILVTVGASHALSCTFLSICNPGDEVLTFDPFFSPYKGFLAVADGVMKACPTKAEENFALPQAEEIEKYITSKTRAIIINSPNNPSGKIYSQEEMERLARLCIKHDLYLIGDEVYREMILGEQQPYSILQIDLKDEELNKKLMDRIIVIDSCSKSFSMCGVRVGFVVARKPIIEKIALVNAHTVACVSDILQSGLAAAYDAVLSNPDYLQELRKTYRTRLEATLEAFKEYIPEAIVPRPAGAFYLMAKFPEFDDIEEFCYYMLQKFNLGGETVAVTPAETFYLDPDAGKNEIRIALVLAPEKMKRSVQIMAEALKSYRKIKAIDNKNLRKML
jgi:aspartate aminotransferase